MKNSDKTLSLHRLENSFLNNKNAFTFPLNSNNTSLYVEPEENPKYIQPILKIAATNTIDSETPNIICISAAGATGKSELSKYLSSHFHAPIFNLSLHNPVGSNSLTGVLFDNLGYDDAPKYINDLRSGQSFLIIDAMDEGSLKTTANGFDSFLDNIISIGKASPSTCFVILGRTQIIDYCYLYFDCQGIKTSLLNIEAFTVDQAKDFINKQLGGQVFEKQYTEVRDYIIETVEGFFKNQSAINNMQYLSFIGYAPVLLSISKLLEKEKNYKKLHEELLSKKQKNIDLIISIVELILMRDKEEKINKQLLPELLVGRSKEFCTDVLEKVYNVEEQCFRILCYVLSKPLVLRVSDDPTFNSQYETKISEWIEEHPFLEDKKIQNAVFESYIIAQLINNPAYESIVYEYLNTSYRDAFMLFFLFDKLTKDKRLNHEFIPYLFNSLKSLDSSTVHSSISIDELDFDGHTSECEVEFSVSDNDSYIYSSTIPKADSLFVGDHISDVFVDTDNVTMQLNRGRCVLTPPISISCNNILSIPGELIIENSNCKSGNISIECNGINIDYTKGEKYNLIVRNIKSDDFTILTIEKPAYPFDNYWLNEKNGLELTDYQLKLFKKLRKIIALFKSHSKGRMAKFKDKIEHQRVCGIGDGKILLDELLKKEILYLEDKFYFISPEKIHDHLGLSYDQIKMGSINDKTKEFLSAIN